MTDEQWVFTGATAALVLAFIGGIPPDRRALRHPAVIGAGVLFLISLIVRAIFVHPTLVHADVAAPELVDCILQFPGMCTNRGASYGQYGFFAVGALTRLFGRDLNAVFHAMELIGVLNVTLLAVLAYRLSGSFYGGLLALAITGTNPIFMRVAASEDMHNMGLCLGLVAFIAMDVFAVTRRTLALVAAALALCLMLHTRQSFYVFAPSAFVLGLARGGPRLLTSLRFWASGLVVVAVLLPRVLDSAGNAGLGSLTEQMLSILTQPMLLPDMIRNHGLFDVARFGPLPALTIAALIWACFDGRLARATLIVFVVNFLVTYPCGMRSPGVELAQRLPTFAIGMLIVAMGGAALIETRVSTARRPVAGLLAAVALIALPPLFPGWGTLSVLTPIHREYLAVESAAASLPPEITLVMLPYSESNSYGGSRYSGLLERMGKNVHAVAAEKLEVGVTPRPWLFLENIECWTYSFYEVVGVKKEVAKDHKFEFRWDRVLFGRQPSPVRPPAEIRPQCRPLLRKSVPIGPRRVITDPEDDPPFLFYASDSVPIQFHELQSRVAE